MNLTLYTGPQCALCEDALELLYTTLPLGSYQLTKVDVSASLELKKAYGLRIPVLRNMDRDLELNWPFDQDQLMKFCELGAL